MEFITIKHAKETQLIPSAWHNLFSDHCIYCESDMVISDSLTVMKCSNPRCYRRIAGQVTNILSELGYKGWGNSKVYSYVKHNKITSPLEFILDPPYELSTLQSDISELNYSYIQLIQLLNIPHLRERIPQLFKGIDTFEEYVTEVEKSGGLYSFCANRLGGSTLPTTIANTLAIYYPELACIHDIFPVVKHASKVMLIAITGCIRNVTSEGKHLTKDAYISVLNDLLRPAGLAVRRSDALSSVSYIVADYPSSSAKYRKGAERGILVTSDVLYQVCEQLVAMCNKKGENTENDSESGTDTI